MVTILGIYIVFVFLKDMYYGTEKHDMKMFSLWSYAGTVIFTMVLHPQWTVLVMLGMLRR